MGKWPLSAMSLNAAQSPPLTAEHKARALQTQVEMLRFDVERLLMVAEALWDILRDKHGLDDEELARRIHEIDLRDGRLDGRVAPEPPGKCPRCGRVLERKRPYCLYCGQAIAADPFQR